MATTPTSSLSSARLAGLSDELQKISEATQSRGEKLKKLLSTSALVAGGAGAGAAVTTVADRFLKNNLGSLWKNTDPKVKTFVVGPLLGVATLGSIMAAKALAKERAKRDS